ncbi:hypothetical protein K3712_000544 [Escherichia coli]|nr:hypothetical protein [Escherichia coli]
MGGLNGILHRAGDLVSYPVKISKDLVTHPKKGWDELTHLYSHNEHEDSKMLNGIGIHGWVGKHPQEAAMIAVATVFGGWAAWGAYGAGAAGSAAGAAGSTGAAGGASGSGIAAGTMIGQTVPMTPGMVGAAAGQGSAIGVGGSAAANAAAASTTGSTSILSGASASGASFNTGAFTAHYGGEAQVGSASGTNGGSSSMGWQDWVKNANRANNMLNQKGNQQQQQTQPMKLQSHLDQNSLGKITVGQISPGLPNSTTDIIGNSGSNSFTPQFSNNF